jgi:hypothetical protein
MPEAALKEHAHRARDLAMRAADLIIASQIPPAHWDEVLERLAELLASHQASLASEEANPEQP